MVATIGKLWFMVVGCTSRVRTQYRQTLAKDWERPTKRAIMARIMHSDKTLSIKASSDITNQKLNDDRDFS
jgi:hypothetical protein